MSGTVYSQTYYRIRTGAFDSLAFLAQKGKICDSLSETHLKAITALQISDQQKGQVIALQSSQLENYRILDANWSASMQNQADLFLIDKAQMRTKLKKRSLIIVGQSGIIVVLLAIVLL